MFTYWGDVLAGWRLVLASSSAQSDRCDGSGTGRLDDGRRSLDVVSKELNDETPLFQLTLQLRGLRLALGYRSFQLPAHLFRAGRVVDGVEMR